MIRATTILKSQLVIVVTFIQFSFTVEECFGFLSCNRFGRFELFEQVFDTFFFSFLPM